MAFCSRNALNRLLRGPRGGAAAAVALVARALSYVQFAAGQIVNNSRNLRGGHWSRSGNTFSCFRGTFPGGSSAVTVDDVTAAHNTHVTHMSAFMCLHAAVWDREPASSDAPATRVPEHHLRIPPPLLAACCLFPRLHSSITCTTPANTHSS